MFYYSNGWLYLENHCTFLGTNDSSIISLILDQQNEHKKQYLFPPVLIAKALHNDS